MALKKNKDTVKLQELKALAAWLEGKMHQALYGSPTWKAYQRQLQDVLIQIQNMSGGNKNKSKRNKSKRNKSKRNKSKRNKSKRNKSS